VIVWDSAVAGFRTSGYTTPVISDPMQVPDHIRNNPVIPQTIIDSITAGRIGWSPKVPPGYTTPPAGPGPVVPPIPVTAPSTPSGPHTAPGDGSWRVDCRTQGSVRTCHYTPIGSSKGYSSSNGDDEWDDSGIGYFEYLHEDLDIEERDYWEYDRCKPWNPCDTKPGMVKGYSPPGLYDSKKTTKKASVTKVKTSKPATAKKTTKKKK
jgi:hypothetical protein